MFTYISLYIILIYLILIYTHIIGYGLKKENNIKDKSTALEFVWICICLFGLLGFIFVSDFVSCQTMRSELLMERSKKRSIERSLGTQQVEGFCINNDKSYQARSMLRQHIKGITLL